MARCNEAVAALLDDIARLLTIQGDSAYRVRAYLEAARNIDTLPDDVEKLWRTGRLQEIPGVGQLIATKVAEYLDTGHSSYYERLKLAFPVEATELLDVPSIGPARAHLLHERLGIRSLPDLVRAARAHELRGLPGFGPQLEARIAREADRIADHQPRAA